MVSSDPTSLASRANTKLVPGSAYLFTLCAFQPIIGKIFTLLPIKYVYLGSLLTFEIGSAICGFAPNSICLILGRAIAGIGAAGDFSGGLTIIAHTVPLEKRPMGQYEQLLSNGNMLILSSHRASGSILGHCLCSWATAGRRAYHSRFLEMVFLD